VAEMAGAIRECWRRNDGWLKMQGLRLVGDPKKERTWWYLEKEKV